MKLKAKREAMNNPPSEFALRVPDIDKRNDNLLKQGHTVVLPSNTLQTYSLTDGAYIKKHTVNNMGHKVSNFTPKFLALLKKSSPSSEYPADDEPPVEGGAEDASVVEGSKQRVVDDAKTSASSDATENAVAEAGDFELFDIAPPDLPAGRKEVWEPVGQAYIKLKFPIVLLPERQGASMIVKGKTLGEMTEADLPELKQIVTKMGTLRDRLEGSFHKRVKSDVKKIEIAIKRLDPAFKGERVKSKSASGGGGGGGGPDLPEVVEMAGEVLGPKAKPKVVKEMAKLARGGGKK
jgi:hypothetical protein